MSDSTAPIFILSAERSGSTLLRYILDTHPRICCPAEVNLSRLCRELHTVLVGTVGNVMAEPADPRERERILWGQVRQHASSIMDAYARGKGKDIWAEKTPENLLDTEALLRTFPDARFICLHRECMDFVHSALEICKFGWWSQFISHVQRSPQSTVAAMIEYWCDRTERLLAFETNQPEHSVRVTYESLVKERDVLLPIFAFLGLSCPDDLLGSVFTASHDHGPGDQKIRYSRELDSANVGKGAGVPLGRVPQALLERANGLLVGLGYRPLGEVPPTKPLNVASPRADAGAGGVREIFEQVLPRKLRDTPNLAEDINASFKFVLDDGVDGIWFVDLTRAGGAVLAGDRPADYTFSVKSSVFLSIIRKDVHPFTAFQDGSVHISGNLESPTLAAFVQRVLM